MARRETTTIRNSPRMPGFWRRGQTAVEYLLVTLALTTAFAMSYRVLQWYLARQFREGGVVILKMYQEFPY